MQRLRRIQRDGAIKPGRAELPAGLGVHVEVEPFGPTTPGLDGPSAHTGAYQEGAYVEFDLPSDAVPTSVGPRITAVIPTTNALRLDGLNPRFVRVRQWWNLWYFWR